MTLLNPLSLSVATHLSLDSIRATWWNPSDLAASASPPQPENRSTTVRTTVVDGLSALSCLLSSRLGTPSKQEVAVLSSGLLTPSSGCEVIGSVGWVSTPSSGMFTTGLKVSVGSTPSFGGNGDGGGWVVGKGGTVACSNGAEAS